MMLDGYIRTTADQGDDRAVQDVMSLYGIPLVKETTANTLVVGSELLPDRVVTSLAWQGKTWQETHEIVFFHAQDQAAPGRVVRRNLALLLEQAVQLPRSSWGILRGVRPGKIVRRLFDEGYTKADIAAVFEQEYLAAPEKAALLLEIALRQRDILPPETPRSVGVYVGIPFCPSRCLYCSFPSFVLPPQEKLQIFMQALKADIVSAGHLLRQQRLQMETLYIGGGTPTSLPAKELEQLLSWIQEYLGRPKLGEWTVEAGRPDSLNAEKIAVLKGFPISRLSLNPQSMQEKTLQRIGRKHSVQDIIEMFASLRQNGFSNINMDIILGLPGETPADVQHTLREIAKLSPESLTVHTLALKRGSALAEKLLLQEEVPLPDAAAVAEMIEASKNGARAMGMAPYYLYRQKQMAGQFENIGYAKEGRECAYNIRVIEERQSILGIGPHATSKIVEPDGYRLHNCYHAKQVDCYIRDIDRYIANREVAFRRFAGRE